MGFQGTHYLLCHEDV